MVSSNRVVELNPFQGNEHRSFSLDGGEPAALLVHGFPGTPDEMRPLAESLHAAGWSVVAPLLSGFGPEIELLPQYTHDDWAYDIMQRLEELQRTHAPVVLVGHSMGGSLAIRIAAARRPDALVLLAPFWRLDVWWHPAWPLLQYVVREFKPFDILDMDDPEMRAAVEDYLPNADLNDPHVRRQLQDYRVPSTVIAQALAAGRQARLSAPAVTAPTLLIQGQHDELVTVERTRQLLQRLGGRLRYEEVDAEHNLVDPNAPAWSQVQRSVLQFVETFIDPAPAKESTAS